MQAIFRSTWKLHPMRECRDIWVGDLEGREGSNKIEYEERLRGADKKRWVGKVFHFLYKAKYIYRVDKKNLKI